ncbi:MAG TPA: nucleotidyltransferase domain-containing protein [Anaerolineales bacterium]|nr:nucleotidyltransferase domain-containing protein [Anaerolineales bacterium]
MSDNIRKLLAELKNELIRIYGEQLKGVYLYGSYARDENQAGSDVDVMIVLASYQRYGDEIKRTSELNAKLSLDYNLSVSRLLMTEDRWKNDNSPLLRNVRAQGQPA